MIVHSPFSFAEVSFVVPAKLIVSLSFGVVFPQILAPVFCCRTIPSEKKSGVVISAFTMRGEMSVIVIKRVLLSIV